MIKLIKIIKGNKKIQIWEILYNNGNKTGKTMQKDDEKVWQKGIYHRGADVWIINSEKKILIQ